MAFIEVAITGEDAVAARINAADGKLREALVKSMQRQWFRIQAAVVTQKLSGDPLHRRTGVLASSINVGGADSVTAFEQSPTEIIGRIGTRVRYGRIHEDGGTVQIAAHERRVTTVFGRSVSPHTITVGAHTATFPQRSFLRSTLRDMRASVIDAIESDIAAAAKEA